MKIFILEDNHDRIDFFMEKFRDLGKNTVVVSEDVSTAISKYKDTGMDCDVIFLDHDLGGRVYVESQEENTGYQFAKWLRFNDPNIDKKKIILHTCNSVGADNMKNELPIASAYPYYLLADFLRSCSPDVLNLWLKGLK